MKEKVLAVEGMTCGHCKAAVEGALETLTGVSGAKADLEAGKVYVTYDEANVTVAEMITAIEEQGYDVSA